MSGLERPGTARVHFASTGRCVQGEEANWRYKTFFASTGCVLVPAPEEADFIVVATCGFLEKELQSSLRLIRELERKKRPEARLVVAGCVPINAPAALRSAYDGEAIASVRDLFGLRRWLRERATLHRSSADGADIAPFSDLAQAYIVKVSDGCMSRCSFCAIKNSIGDTRSRPPKAILRDIRTGLDRGFKVFILSSDDNGAYGFDTGTTILSLLEQVLAMPGDFQVYVHQIHPQWLSRFRRPLISLFRHPRIAVAGSMIQSGSDRILKLMRRNCSAGEFRDIVLEIYETVPSLRFSSAVICGFPSETETEFEESVRLIEELRMDWVDVYGFDERPGTSVPPDLERLARPVIEARCARMLRAAGLGAAARRASRPPEFRDGNPAPAPQPV